jgi:hypothetical protein
MGIPISLLLGAAGAILAFAVTGKVNGVDLDAVGWILMVAGFVGLVLSLVMWDTWAGGGFWHRRAYYDEEPPVAPRRRVVREDVTRRY